MVEKGVPTLNLIIKNKFGKNFEANLSITNILDPDISLIRENTNVEDNSTLLGEFVKDGDVTLREFNRGINLGLTLKYNF
ncbi:hypothetical protein JCM19301_618 [Jejuia pallidilutea]|nr:hypothetical protein JCM19301_618 [Jejuia pallidilutea]